MSAPRRPTCGRLDAVLSIFATRTGWRRAVILFDRTLNPVSGQRGVTLWRRSTLCWVGAAWACGLGLGLDLPHAVITRPVARPVAVRADRVRATRRTRYFSIAGGS